MNCLSPSILAADISCLGEQIKMIDEAGAQYVHIDIMVILCLRFHLARRLLNLSGRLRNGFLMCI